MAEPIINEMEEEVVSQPTEEPIVGEEPKKTGEEPKNESYSLFDLKDGSQVKVFTSDIEAFKKSNPDSVEVLSEMKSLSKKPVAQPKVETEVKLEEGTLKNPTKIVGDDGKVGELKVDITKDDYDNVEDLLIKNDIYALAISPSKQAEIDQTIITGMGEKPGINMSADLWDAEIDEYARQNGISVEDAAYIVSEKKKSDKLDELFKKDQKKLDALAKVYSEKNNVNYDVSKALFKKVYDDAFNTKNTLDAYNQAATTAQSIIRQSPKNKKGDADLDEQSYTMWQSASNTATQAQYQLIQGRIERGELKQALADAKKLESDLLEKANIESHYSFKQGTPIDRRQYANQNMASAVALQATIMNKMGDAKEAKRLEQIARDNGAYQGMEKLEKLQQQINATKDVKEKERLAKEYAQEYQTIGLETIGGGDVTTGYKQPEVSTGSTYGFSGKNAAGTTTPTAESEYLKDIAGAAELASGIQPLKDSVHLMSEGFKDLTSIDYVSLPTYGMPSVPMPDKPLTFIAGLVKIMMGLSAVQKPTGFLMFEAFAAANASPTGQKVIENTIMLASKIAKPYLREMGLDEKDIEDAGLLTDIAAAIVLHSVFNIVKGKVQTNAAYKKLAEQIKSGNVDENLVKEIFNSVDPKQQQKIIRKIANDYKKSPNEVKKEIGEGSTKVLNLIATKKTTKKTSYTPEEHPNTVSEIKNDSKVVMKDGTEGTFNISDEGIMSVTDAEGNKTIIETKGDAPVAEAGIQLVKSKVSEELEAQARVNRPDAGTIVVNGKKYFVSLEGKTADGLGDFVFEMDEKGNMYNTFDVNPNKDLVGQNKLDIVNAYLDRNGQPLVTELVEPIPADVEAVTSAEAVTQVVSKLRKLETTEGMDKSTIKETKRKISELLANNPKVKFVYDNMREVLEQINTNKRFKLKGDCL
jgi:hypothetical protein